jgi:sporulation protein YlmC with PRC-barrel domain
MRRYRSAAAVSLLILGMAAPVMAQGFLDPYMTADHSMRASRVIGMPVYNERNEKLGTVEDITLPAMGGEVTAILSVGGFLGVGQKLIKVPLSHVHFDSGKPMMPADKAMLMAMPNYTYMGGGGG